jgi:hypothetical protein
MTPAANRAVEELSQARGGTMEWANGKMEFLLQRDKKEQSSLELHDE